jgi:hypothetical protein
VRTILDRHVLALDKSFFLQTLLECQQEMLGRCGRRLRRKPITGIGGTPEMSEKLQGIAQNTRAIAQRGGPFISAVPAAWPFPLTGPGRPRTE